MAFKLKVKKCTPSLFSPSVGVQFTPKLGNHAHTKQRKATPTQLLQLNVKFKRLSC